MAPITVLGATVVDKTPAKQSDKQYLPHQFKPGQSGNPNGRAPGKMISKNVREAAVDKIEQWFDQFFIQEASPDDVVRSLNSSAGLSLADRVMLKAIINKDKGTEVIENLLNRILGKPAPMKSPDGEGGESALETLIKILKSNQGEGNE